MKRFLKNTNGWILAVVPPALFFAAPSLYRLIDPTAGAFDAGYVHAIIFAVMCVPFFIGVSWLVLYALAPGLFKAVDSFFESSRETYPSHQARMGTMIFGLIFIAMVIILCNVV